MLHLLIIGIWGLFRDGPTHLGSIPTSSQSLIHQGIASILSQAYVLHFLMIWIWGSFWDGQKGLIPCWSTSLLLNATIFACQDMITSQSCQMTVMDWGSNLVGASPSSAPSVFSYSSSSQHQMHVAPHITN